MTNATANEQLLGSWLLGGMVACFLFGINASQARFYYSTFSRDPLYLKLTVGGLFTSATASWIILIYVDWIYFIEERYTPARSIHPLNIRFVLFVFPILAAVISQSFFATRISYSLNPSPWRKCHQFVSFLLILGSVSIGIIGLIISIIYGQRYITEYQSFGESRDERALVESWRWSEVAMNLYLTILIFCQPFPKNARRERNKRDEEHIFTKILKGLICTNLLAFIFVFVDAIVAETTVQIGNIHLAFLLQFPYIYSLSVTYTLNSRDVKETRIGAGTDDADSRPTFARGPRPPSSPASRSPTANATFFSSFGGDSWLTNNTVPDSGCSVATVSHIDEEQCDIGCFSLQELHDANDRKELNRNGASDVTEADSSPLRHKSLSLPQRHDAAKESLEILEEPPGRSVRG
ncbi:hypothetical protein BT69DRAFT_1327629 [Atractiella rhizophila]|nr:hypothetical protein BT69DRAFT_1327629 [Atractiella rhizophila]